jgi:rhodanese-related sulfurtransferase
MKGFLGRRISCFVFAFYAAFPCVKAQDIDTVKSDYIYALLSSNNFNKTIIDGRDSAMFCSGHIKNAVVIDAFSKELSKNLQKYLAEDTLIVYCTKNRRSNIIIENLKLLNYKGLVIYMQDGLTGWKENKFEIVTPPKL